MNTASKPSYAHLVKELDREEALVLEALGLPVWRDWSSKKYISCWDREPFLNNHMIPGGDHHYAFYYTRNDAVE